MAKCSAREARSLAPVGGLGIRAECGREQALYHQQALAFDSIARQPQPGAVPGTTKTSASTDHVPSQSIPLEQHAAERYGTKATQSPLQVDCSAGDERARTQARHTAGGKRDLPNPPAADRRGAEEARFERTRRANSLSCRRHANGAVRPCETIRKRAVMKHPRGQRRVHPRCELRIRQQALKGERRRQGDVGSVIVTEKCHGRATVTDGRGTGNGHCCALI